MKNSNPKTGKNKSAADKGKLPELVVQTFGQYPTSVKDRLLEVRALIFQVQQADSDIGELDETLRWGEVSYLTGQSKSGSMVRLAMTRSGDPAVFFHCGTTLIERFRGQYGHVFEFDSNRALILTRPVAETKAELLDCLRQAFRYKLDNVNRT